MAENDSGLRSDLEAAYDAVAKEPVEAPVAAPEAPAEVVATEPVGIKVGADGKPRDEKGRYLSPEKAAIGGDKAEAASTPPKVEDGKAPEIKAEAPAEPTPIPEQPKPERLPPKSLPAPLREAWKKLDDVEKDFLLKREGEVARTMTETSEARQTFQKFKETVSPYEHMFRAEGVEPIQGINNLLRTTAALATGPQQTKAQIVAGIIKTYGVDIATLDALLAGQPVQNVPQSAPYDPRVDQLLAQINQAKAQQETRLQQQAQQALSEIENEEFFDDVRDDMADLLEVAAKRGVALSPKDAYNRAVALNPAVSRVLEQRKAAATQGATQRAVAASSSVKAQPTAAPSGPAGDSIRDALEAAWDRVHSKRT